MYSNNPNHGPVLFFASSSDQRSFFLARGQKLGAIANIFLEKMKIFFQKMSFCGFCYTRLSHGNEVGGSPGALHRDWVCLRSQGADDYR